MSPSVIIHRAQDIESALVLTNFLQFHGFDARLDNAGHAAVDWGIVPALGGIAIRLPRAQVDEARQALRAALNEADAISVTDYQRRTRRKRLLAYSMLGIYFGLIPLVVGAIIVGIAYTIPAEWFPAPAQAISDPMPPYPIFPSVTVVDDPMTGFSNPAPPRQELRVAVWLLLALFTFLLGLERVTRPTPDELASEPE